MSDPTQEFLSLRYRDFARIEAHGVSPLYEMLSHEISRDEQILKLSAFTRPEQPIPNMLFAAVRFLQLKDNDGALPFMRVDAHRQTQSLSQIYPSFRKYCLENKAEIRVILEEKRVQTNEIGRCSGLLPGFVEILKETHGRPWTLIDVGASAGLNLNFDRYLYKYRDATWGNIDSSVRIDCDVKGENAVHLQDTSFNIERRIGIDINPLDVSNEEDMLWLRALVWPDQADREIRLVHALDIAREYPPTMVTGDALDASRKILESSEKDNIFVFFSSFAFNQLSSAIQDDFYNLLKEHGNRHDVFLLTMGFSDKERVELKCFDFRNGEQKEKVIAICDAYGKWIRLVE